jgi:hypothetical protein
MQRTSYKRSFIVFGLAAFSVAPLNQAMATTDYPVCYKVVDRDDNKAYGQGYYSPERLVLDVSFHSHLKTTRSNGRQTVYDADGKHTYWAGGSGHNANSSDHTVMAAFDGTVVTSNYAWKQPKGSHLGGTSYFVRDPHHDAYGPEGGPYYSPIHWECTSREARPDPDTWRCTITYQPYISNNSNVGSYEYKGVYLKKVKYNRDEKCDIFQDTEDYIPTHNYDE